MEVSENYYNSWYSVVGSDNKQAQDNAAAWAAYYAQYYAQYGGYGGQYGQQQGQQQPQQPAQQSQAPQQQPASSQQNYAEPCKCKRITTLHDFWNSQICSSGHLS